MDGVGGYAGWRWIFILEGLLTILVALVAPFAIHDSPETAKFLTDEERRFVIHNLRIQHSADSHEVAQQNEKFQIRYVIDALGDWQIWLGILSKCQPFLFVSVLTGAKCIGASLVLYTESPCFFLPLLRIWVISRLLLSSLL
jgi:hypothetical protein